MPDSNVIIPLDSYRLAQYTAQVPCYICSGPNTFDAELCRHCYAPMALTHQANTQHVLPQMIATIGATGAGKTVYLGMLTDMLSRQDERLQILARGAFSISLQQNTVKALSRCEFPQKTPNEPDRWHWVHCQVRMKQRKRPLELIMPDMAGETILHETDHPNSYPVIRSLLLQCAGVIVLVDAARIAEGQSDQDFFTMKLLSYLMELDSDRKRGWPNRPVAVIFSKSDQCEECFADPAGFARKQSPGVWQQCQERFKRHKFFASGVAGACTSRPEFGAQTMRVPLRIEPRGIGEPFRWVMEQLK
jgi:hypothetical protein